MAYLLGFLCHMGEWYVKYIMSSLSDVKAFFYDLMYEIVDTVSL
tara:strand:+ start:68022 stop:68153 length:132 start_codon:yes stop_codon:yes gene_type:complete